MGTGPVRALAGRRQLRCPGGGCLLRLSERTRDIFLAHRVDGLSYQEIARQHQVSVSTVERHVAKALMLPTAWMEGW